MRTTYQSASPWDARLETTRSRGHWAWAYSRAAGGLVEYWVDGISVWRSPAANAIDLDSGSRCGRWEGPDTEAYREHLRVVWSNDAQWEETERSSTA